MSWCLCTCECTCQIWSS